MSARPLDGILVVSLEQAVAAPMASCRLADAGARVIKVERTGGDFARGYDTAANGGSSYFTWLNRGKESIALDIKEPQDRAIFDAMLDRADIFIQNLAVGAVERAGFDAATLQARNPRLIVCNMSGYGREGPYAQMKAYDLLIQAESGLVSVSGPPGDYGRVGVSVVDISTGIQAALLIHEALWERQRTGKGRVVDVAMFEVMADWMTVPLLHHDYLGAAPRRVGLAHPTIAPYGGYRCSDGLTVLISIQSDGEWRDLARLILKRPDLAEDENYATNHARVANRDEVDRLVGERFATAPSGEWAERLKAARIAFGMVNDVAALSTHPHLRRIRVEGECGPVEMPAPPGKADMSDPGRVPAVDAHGPAIRREFGFPDDRS